MAGSGQAANVQAYLDKHKISTLFEDLTSLLVKNLPTNPIDFLISKLEEKNKKKAVTGRSTISSTGQRKPVSAGTKTGPSSTVKPKAATTTTSSTAKTTGKPSSTAKSTTTSKIGGTGRTVSKTVGSGPSKPTTKTAPTSTKGPASTSTKGPSTKAPSTPGTSRPTTSKVPTKSPSGGTKSGIAKKPSATGLKSTSTKPTKPTADGAASKTRTVKKAEPEKKQEPKEKPEEPQEVIVSETVKEEEKSTTEEQSTVTEPTDTTATDTETGVTDDSTTGADDETTSTTADSAEKPTDKQPDLVPEEEPSLETRQDDDGIHDDGIHDDGIHDDSIHDDKDPPIEEEDDDEQMVEPVDSGTSLDMEELMRLKRAQKLAKHGVADKSHLKELLASSDNTSSTDKEVGVVDQDKDDESEDEGLEVVESHETLEAEGVVVSEQARRMSMKLPESAPKVDLLVTICARCAKIIGADEESVVISSSRLTSIDPGFDDSASQVVGMQVPFPQWDGTSSVGSVDTELSLKQKWALTGQSAVPSVPSTTGDEESSVEPVKQTSDEESELKLPDPVDYVKPTDEEETVVASDDVTERED